jgi:predicted amidohydrolase YtcJ
MKAGDRRGLVRFRRQAASARSLGSIEAGNHADLAVLDRDYFTVPDEDIRRIRSVLTVVGGRIVHNDGVA